MKNKDYWTQRILEDTEKKFDDHNEVLQEKLKKLYKSVSNKMVKEIDDIYFKLLEDSVTRTDIWTYKHYRDLSKRLSVLAAKVGLEEEKILNVQLEIALKEIYKETPLPTPDRYTLLDEVTIKRLVASKWTDKHFSERIWTNKGLMLERLKKGLTESIVMGKSKDKAVTDIMDKCNSSFNDADRLVRTELMHTLNQGKIERYRGAGYTDVEIIVCEDERTCDSCEVMQGAIRNLDSDELPPFHPRCRCTFIPVIKWEG